MKTYVIQDWLGLYHIIQSDKPTTEVYKSWLLDTDNFMERSTKLAINKDDLYNQLKSMEVETTKYLPRESHDNLLKK